MRTMWQEQGPQEACSEVAIWRLSGDRRAGENRAESTWKSTSSRRDSMCKGPGMRGGKASQTVARPPHHP